jgi:hypothetical protein
MDEPSRRDGERRLRDRGRERSGDADAGSLIYHASPEMIADVSEGDPHGKVVLGSTAQ